MTNGQQVCLKWNSFHSSLASGFKSLWEEDGLVDVTLASDGQFIQAHKLILSACSPFFRDVFKANPCQHPVIILQGTHFQELESLICFVYKGEVNIEQENLPALLRAAETLQIRGLSGATEQLTAAVNTPTEPTVAEESFEDSSPTVSKKSRTEPAYVPTSPKGRHSHYSRLYPKRTKSAQASHRSCNSNLSVPVSIETVLQNRGLHLSPERVPKIEPLDLLEVDGDSQAPSVLSGSEEGVDNNTALFLGSVVDLKVHQDRISTADTGQNKAVIPCSMPVTESSSVEQLAYQKLPYADLLPEHEVLSVWSKSRTPEQLACDLMKVLFSVEERLVCNVNGKLGKRQFNVHKIQLIREVLHHFTSLNPVEFEEQWKYCITKIDTANRGLKRNMVVRGRKTMYFI